jgi:biofilm PGA synthesis protein PgaD
MNPAREKNSLIIDRPDWVRPGEKFTALGITLLFWGALLYLWQPLLSLLAWGLNIHLFYNHMIVLGGYRAFLNLLAFYSLVIAILGGGLILWARINQWRFRGKNRRLDLSTTDVPQLCRQFALEPADLQQAQQHRRLVITLATDGSIQRVATSPENGDSGVVEVVYDRVEGGAKRDL